MRHNKAIFILSKNLAQVLLNCPLPEAVAPRRLSYQLLWGEGWSVSDTVESRVPKLLPFFFFFKQRNRFLDHSFRRAYNIQKS